MTPVINHQTAGRIGGHVATVSLPCPPWRETDRIVSKTTRKPPKPERTPPRQAVLDELAKGPATLRDLCNATGRYSSTIRDTLAKLKTEGLARKEQGAPRQPATWSLT